MRTNQEVRHQPSLNTVHGPRRKTPEPTRGCGSVIAESFESNAQHAHGSPECGVIFEVGAHLRPDDVTGDERAGVVRGTQGVEGSFTEIRIAAEDIEENRRIDRCLQDERERRPGLGWSRPRISSIKTSTGLRSLRIPKTRSTGCSRRLCLRPTPARFGFFIRRP